MGKIYPKFVSGVLVEFFSMVAENELITQIHDGEDHQGPMFTCSHAQACTHTHAHTHTHTHTPLVHIYCNTNDMLQLTETCKNYNQIQTNFDINNQTTDQIISFFVCVTSLSSCSKRFG